jgi:hypothetical protein
MEQLIELLRQIQELAGVGIEALEQAAGGGAPAGGEGGPPPEGPPPEGQ